MTAPLFLLPAGTLEAVATGTSLTLDGSEGRHAAAVLRLRPGEQVVVADGGGLLGSCRVVQADRDRIVVEVMQVERQPVREPRLVLVQALAKGGRDELAVETATELGVDVIVPWQASRSIVRWTAERGERSRHRWEATVRSAVKQSRRPTVPEVRPAVTTAGLTALVTGSLATFVLHERAGEPLVTAPLPTDGSPGQVLVVVGPEGGIAQDEVAVLAAAGGCAVRLGPHVLRSSSAGAAALAILAARLHRWE